MDRLRKSLAFARAKIGQMTLWGGESPVSLYPFFETERFIVGILEGDLLPVESGAKILSRLHKFHHGMGGGEDYQIEIQLPTGYSYKGRKYFRAPRPYHNGRSGLWFEPPEYWLAIPKGYFESLPIRKGKLHKASKFEILSILLKIREELGETEIVPVEHGIVFRGLLNKLSRIETPFPFPRFKLRHETIDLTYDIKDKRCYYRHGAYEARALRLAAILGNTERYARTDEYAEISIVVHHGPEEEYMSVFEGASSSTVYAAEIRENQLEVPEPSLVGMETFKQIILCPSLRIGDILFCKEANFPEATKEQLAKITIEDKGEFFLIRHPDHPTIEIKKSYTENPLEIAKAIPYVEKTVD